jgi:uncharacterized protein (DUF2062 family)
MLFKRREKPTQWERLRLWLWPRVSWRRSFVYYLKRILRLSGTPYAIAMGAAVGATVSLTPLLGFHLIIAFAVAWVLRGNLIASGIGTLVGNPLTYPFIWTSTYELGHLLMNGVTRDAPIRLGYDLMHKSIDQILPAIKLMLVGSLPLGIAVGTITFLVTYKAIDTYQKQRSLRLTTRGRVDDGALGRVGRGSA